MNSHVRYLPWQLLIFGNEALRNSFLFKEKAVAHFYPDQLLRDLARILITEIAKVSAPKNAPAAGESGNQRPKRRKDKLIRLNDLIPKQDVTGGQQLLFGVTDTRQSINKPTKDK
jgi:hypothetical protein